MPKDQKECDLKGEPFILSSENGLEPNKKMYEDTFVDHLNTNIAFALGSFFGYKGTKLDLSLNLIHKNGEQKIRHARSC